jgi:FkbM family methyltransferase
MLQQRIENTTSLVFKNGKIVIPDSITNIKLDIGLSYSAPQTQNWLQFVPSTYVFCFEPNPEAVAAIQSPTNAKRHPSHGDVLEHKYVNKNAFIIPVALGNSTADSVPFHITKGDIGCSSLYVPKVTTGIQISHTIEVPLRTLTQFFDLLDFTKFQYIDYIKVDAQGADLDILKGAGSYLSERVVYVTIECDTEYISREKNSVQDVESYLTSQGFKRIAHPNTSDPTFVNTRFLHVVNDIYIYQRG